MSFTVCVPLIHGCGAAVCPSNRYKHFSDCRGWQHPSVLLDCCAEALYEPMQDFINTRKERQEVYLRSGIWKVMIAVFKIRLLLCCRLGRS